MQAMTLLMDYRAGEYLRIVDEVFRGKKAEMIAAGHDSLWWRLPAWLEQVLLCAVALPGFYYKMHKLGSCRFDIDADEIRRSSKMGMKSLTWQELMAVRRLQDAYLLELKQGAMPLLHRCMSAPQRAALERLVDERGLWAPA